MLSVSLEDLKSANNSLEPWLQLFTLNRILSKDYRASCGPLASIAILVHYFAKADRHRNVLFL